MKSTQTEGTGELLLWSDLRVSTVSPLTGGSRGFFSWTYDP
jgi:hypothetical protein